VRNKQLESRIEHVSEVRRAMSPRGGGGDYGYAASPYGDYGGGGQYGYGGQQPALGDVAATAERSDLFSQSLLSSADHILHHANHAHAADASTPTHAPGSAGGTRPGAPPSGVGAGGGPQQSQGGGGGAPADWTAVYESVQRDASIAVLLDKHQVRVGASGGLPLVSTTVSRRRDDQRSFRLLM